MTQEPKYVPVEDEKEITTTNGEPTEMTIANEHLESLAFMSPNDIPDLSDENVTVGASLAPQYYQGFINPGDSVRAIFNGITITKSRKNVPAGQPPKEIPTAVFQNKDGVFLHSGSSLVPQLQKCRPGTPVQITYTGTEKTASGNNVNKFEVRLLNVNPF